MSVVVFFALCFSYIMGLETIATQMAVAVGSALLGIAALNVNNVNESATHMSPEQRAMQFIDLESRKTYSNILLPLKRSRKPDDPVRGIIDVIYKSGTMLMSMERKADEMTLELQWMVLSQNLFVNVQRACEDLDGILYTDASNDYFDTSDALKALVQKCKQCNVSFKDKIMRRFRKAHEEQGSLEGVDRMSRESQERNVDQVPPENESN